MHDDVEQRKSQHLDLAMRAEVEPGTDALFSCVRLVHCALPELALSDIDLSTRLCGAPLRAPFMILGMTGGTERAERINKDLALLAEEEGVAFGVGSMRAVLRDKAALPTFDVRPAKPPLLMANLGAQQLVQDAASAHKLMELLGADGICIHLNAAQELVQEEGDRDFRGCLSAIGQLAQELGERLIVKETGCGISPQVALDLIAHGVKNIDVSGVGGTSWTRVEEMRAQTPRAKALGALLSDWGIPTAAALGAVRSAVDGFADSHSKADINRYDQLSKACGNKSGPISIIASGGIRSGLDAARAIALGADVVGLALPLLRAHQTNGIEGAREVLKSAIETLRAACLLVGATDLPSLHAAPRLIAEPLGSQIDQLISQLKPLAVRPAPVDSGAQ